MLAQALLGTAVLELGDPLPYVGACDGCPYVAAEVTEAIVETVVFCVTLL